MTDITTSVTWQDLIHTHDDELDDLKDAYHELNQHATDEYGDDWQDQPPTDDELKVLQQQAEQYDQAAQSIQKRQHLLETLREQYGDGEFEIKMLSGEETMAVETELRMLAQKNDVSVDAIQVRRNALTVDKATVSAPEGVPTDDDGGPTPSECPNALTLALWEHVEQYNNAGDTGFTAGGVGDTTPAAPTADTSGHPSGSELPSTPSDPTDNA